MKYLGYFLKANIYRIADWGWLLQKVDRRLQCWATRWLSIGGRLTLAQSVIQGIPIYWFDLQKLPVTIIQVIRSRLFNFIWSGKPSSRKWHMCSWQSLSWPKALGGWGLRNLEWFNEAMLTRSIWRAFTDEGLWSRVIRVKYLKTYNSLQWLINVQPC